MKKLADHFCTAALISLCFLAKTEPIQAQISSDGSLSTQVVTNNNQEFTIINGNRVGSNLFHSFSEFSVPTGGTAVFANDANVQNIISRVTGASISNIDGLIQTNGSANLVLINPNGIIFGQNASLNINGSFVASTASHLLFADGTVFSATNPQTPALLTVSVPVGLQFGQTAQPIETQGSTLRVTPGQTLALLGGDLLINGGVLGAPEGRIELGSVAANSLVSLTPIGAGWALGYDGVQNFQDIKVSQGAFIATDGNGNGAMQLRGRKIAIANGSQVAGTTEGDKPGQPLIIKASESVEVSDRSQLRTLTLGTGAAGDITIETRRLIVRDNATIQLATRTSGQGGNLTVNASESLEVLGGGFSTTLRTQTSSTSNDAGNAGTVKITSPRVILHDGGQISTSTLGAGKGGTLIVNASEFVQASGRSVNVINLPSGLQAESRRQGRFTTTGNGGDLIINTPRLLVQNGASLSVAAINGSTGQAGMLDINASDSVTVTGTGIGQNGQIVPSTLRAASEGSGSAGDLRINTATLTVQDQAAVSVSSTGAATAGNLDITASNLVLDNQAKLTAETTGGQGDIKLNTGNLILRRGSQITTDATGSNVTGGNITINTDNLAAVPQENSDISANSRDFRGGNVRINAQGVFGIQFRAAPTGLSDITAAGKDSSLNGTVEIITPDVDPSSGLVELAAALVDSSQQIAHACPASQGNTFTITGRGGLPPLPSEALRPNNTVPLTWVTLERFEQGRRAETPMQNSRLSPGLGNTAAALPSKPKIQNKIVEATGWVMNNKGEVVLIASAPAATASSFSTPASCPAS